MNGLALRLSQARGKKTKNSVGYAPLDVSSYYTQNLYEDNTLVNQFFKANSTDEQLTLLKKILETIQDDNNIERTIQFLVVVFFHAEVRHPIKCFLMRYITKNVSLRPSFSCTLTTQIKSSIDHKHEYKKYIEVVSKVAMCIENFPAGSEAVKMLEILLMEYLKKCLQCCVDVLRITKTLSPTEKNEIFNLAHLAIRLLLYIVQKANSPSKLNHIFKDIRECLRGLMFDDDVPMDTKSVCGILYLNMQLLENGADSWMDILEHQPNDNNINSLLSNEASQLSLFSAIVTVVPVDLLQQGNIQGEMPIIVLCKKILDIGERSSSESIFILGVTRTLQQISKNLSNVTDTDAGLILVEHLLIFVWAYLEHYMDSVRHLTSQILGNIVRYCARLKREGEAKALSNLFSKLSTLEKTRKSYYLSLTSLINELGAVAIIEVLPNVVADVIQALNVQAVQASATTTLETLLQSHAPHSDTQTIYVQWIEPILSYVSSNSSDSGVLNILENLLARAVRLDENVMTYILPYIKRCATSPQDLKCILMLLNVTRKSGVTGNFSVTDNETEWKGVIGYDVLDLAAVDACEETRILSLSLIVESPKSTEVFTREELNFVLKYLKYNINAQAPNFRQLTLSMMKKFIKRLEDSYKHHLKQSSENYYILFVERLRAFCFECLTPGANYSRRFVTLQVLSWCEAFSLYGYHRIWLPEYIEKLLLHLEDSYENNKALALDILGKCPTDILQKNTYSICLQLKDIIKQASALKPTECVSASYKLSLLINKLPDCILQGEKNTTPEQVSLVLLRNLQSVLRTELEICQASVINACAKAPMYGVLHCMRRIVTSFDADAISTDQQWREIIDDIIEDCISVNAAVACVVNNSSPEGHLPMDMSGVDAHLHEGGVRLEDGRQVTAQMVLLCAWRSVKEVSLLLGEISSRLTIAGEKHPEATLSPRQMLTIGEHFTKLLAETKHRGAFEQAYVGFTKLLTRLWRCRSPELHKLPRTWLNDLMLAIASGEKKGTLCATRRSAGLPFMIQALVTTELQIQGNPKCFHQCMTTLLHLARTPPQPVPDSETAIETKTHAINILRALFRNSMLEESVSGYVGEGLLVALLGFEGSTWMERNSSTLLFSALMVRIFGVQRSRDTENLSTRNRMTGRIFFLRYPMLYDFILEKLNEVSSSDDTQILRPSLYPILLLLARLYPSALEGTVSNLKLVAYIPHVLACAKSSVLKTRQLAAKAMVPLISPEQYVTHLETMIDLISEKNIKRNYCHGILLQLLKLLDAKPHDLLIDEQSEHRLENKIAQTTWILEQATGNMPCYLLADEYVKVINLIIWRFPSLMRHETIRSIEKNLEELVFNNKEMPKINSGRDNCLSNALYLYIIILNRCKHENIHDLICKSLSHKSYEVVLTILNYLLILYKNLDIEGKFQEHLCITCDRTVVGNLSKNDKYVQLLCNILKNNKYIECIQKSLKILTLENSTEKYVVETKICDNNMEINDIFIIDTLIDCIRNEHENLTHIYLESLAKFVTRKINEKELKVYEIFQVLIMMYACSSSDNNDETRSVVVTFLELNFNSLFNMNLDGLSEEDQFQYKSTLFATLITTLEDDDSSLRQRTSNTITQASVVSSRAAEVLRDMVDDDGVFVVLALLDFRSEVCISDDGNDECRVFDQNERYNIYLEETIWTNECARQIKERNKSNHNVIDYVLKIIHNPTYERTLQKLCGKNVILFEKMCNNQTINRVDIINPKIRLLVNCLQSFQ